MSLNIIDWKINRSPPSVKRKPQLKTICQISFGNKNNEKINLSRIFHYPLVEVVLPKTNVQFDTITMVYILISSMRTKIFYFSTFFNNLNGKVFLEDNIILPIEYIGLPFVGKEHNHIIKNN